MIDLMKSINVAILLEKSVNPNTRKQKNGCRSELECETDPEPPAPIHIDEIVEEWLVRTRRLLVVGEINEIASTHICSYLQLFSLQSDPVYMYINSPGGCLASGYAIIDQMLACSCPVYTIVRGQGHSMAAMIAAFGQKGHRYSTPNSSLMLHSIIIQNAPDSIERHNQMTGYIEADYKRKVATLARRMKVTTKKLMELMSETQWMSPKQAIKIGLIDGIWTPNKERALNKGYGK